MNETELFELRQHPPEEFQEIGKLREFLENIFEPDFVFPMVVGYRDWSTNNWEIKKLNPLSEEDLLTVRTYLAGLRAFESNQEGQEFRGSLYYSGIDNNTRESIDDSILQVFVKEKMNTSQSYSLYLNYSTAPNPPFANDKVGYAAASKICETRLEKLASRFQGPNKEYRRLMI